MLPILVYSNPIAARSGGSISPLMVERGRPSSQQRISRDQSIECYHDGSLLSAKPRTPLVYASCCWDPMGVRRMCCGKFVLTTTSGVLGGENNLWTILLIGCVKATRGVYVG